MKDKWEASAFLFACPLCGKQMKVTKSSLVCQENHCYDISKRGYINFVQKTSVKIYNAELFEHRRLVYNSGFYDELMERMDLLVSAHACSRKECTVVDSGCGEGTFLTKLSSRISGNKIGFDISKDAILQACKSTKEILWLVADLVNIPLKDNCADVLFNIFTPANYNSFHRILKEDGILIKVIPGIEYLQEFRKAVGTKLKSHRDDEKVIHYLSQYMEIVEKKRVYYKVRVNREQLRSWIKMTPMMVNVSADEEILSSIKEVTIDVSICVCKKRSEIATATGFTGKSPSSYLTPSEMRVQ